MAKPCIIVTLYIAAMAALLIIFIPLPAEASRNLWDMVQLPYDDPFRILEDSPITIPEGLETVALARSDWKETSYAHIFSLDVPGMQNEDIKIEIEENRALRVSGERTAEAVEGEKWHRSERGTGKFWRQFRLPADADLDKIQARLENGILRITVPKLTEDRKKQPKLVNIAQ